MQTAQPAVLQAGERSFSLGRAAFLFTDIAGSTVRWEQNPIAMGADLACHDAIMRAAIERANGRVFKTVGDAFCAIFTCVADALAAARDAQQAILSQHFASGDGLSVRMAIHAGEAESRDDDYFGPTLNRVARLLAIGHGGQVLLSAAAASEAGESATLRDLGRHRLKDLTAPEHVFQLESPDLRAEFPPLRSLTVVENNLPMQATSFVARRGDIAKIEELLAVSRLVTLCGAGGVGKTRCALQAAAENVERFADGVWFADLAPLEDPALVPSTIARVFELQETPNEPAITALVGHLRGKSLLLVLDNCEHVIEKAAAAVAALLASCPDVRLLCTSREGLNVSGETMYRLPSLALTDALALLEQRAQAADPHFTLTPENTPVLSEVCAHLDGIPLAIELAAARLRALSPEQLARKLDERFRVLTGGSRAALPRQQTMRALIDWSYDLLTGDERALFRRLAIFSGGFTEEALMQVCADDELDELALFDLIGSLVDKSLVAVERTEHGTMRYRLLESTREYAREKLAECGELEALRPAHARAYAAIAERIDSDYENVPPDEWTAMAQPELENVRAALTWAFSSDGQADLGVRIAVTLSRMFGVFASAEGLRWVQVALEHTNESTPPLLLAGLELAHASFASIFNRFNTALAAGQRAVTAFVALQQQASAADAQRLVGRSLLYLGRVDEGEELLTKSLAVRQASGSRRTAGILGDLAVARALRGDLPGARTLFARASALFAQEADVSKIAITALTMAEAEFMAGNAELALQLGEEALAAARSAGRHRTAAAILGNIAAYHLHLGDCDRAYARARESFEIARKVAPDVVSLLFAVQHLAASAVFRDDDDAARVAINNTRAAHLLGYVDAQLAKLDMDRVYTEQDGYEKTLAKLRGHFEKAELEAIFAAGAAWDEERAMNQAAAIEAAS